MLTYHLTEVSRFVELFMGLDPFKHRTFFVSRTGSGKPLD